MEKLVAQIDSLYEQFKIDTLKFSNGNKAAGVRARKATIEIAKLMKAWRAESTK